MNKDEANDVNKEIQEEAFDKGSKPEMYFSIGFFCIVFIFSSFLWIILMRQLMVKNREVYNVVYDIPTLGVYHNLYTDFYNKYDRNRSQLFETEEILKIGKNDDFQTLITNVNSFLTSQD